MDEEELYKLIKEIHERLDRIIKYHTIVDEQFANKDSIQQEQPEAQKI